MLSVALSLTIHYRNFFVRFAKRLDEIPCIMVKYNHNNRAMPTGEFMQVTVNASAQYDVVIECGVTGVCGEYFRRLFSPCKIAVITDDNVQPLYFATVKTSLEKYGFDVYCYTIKSGEKSKSLAVYGDILSFLVKSGFTGSDIITSLGGGVVGDLAGFVAATFHRGIKLVHIPTTLLAAIDSSVGGKTAINLPEGKNLVGAFWQPSLVLCDANIFASLGTREWEEGLGELCKYSLLAGEKFDIKHLDNASTMSDIVYKCVEYKAKIVEKDVFDRGERHFLNLGHTLAHAAEKASGYALPHGIAVFYGVKAMVESCFKHGFMDEKNYRACMDLISDYDVKTPFGFTSAELKKYICSDKKISGDKITLVLVKGPGQPFLFEASLSEAEKILCE